MNRSVRYAFKYLKMITICVLSLSLFTKSNTMKISKLQKFAADARTNNQQIILLKNVCELGTWGNINKDP